MREHRCRAKSGSRAGHVYTWLRSVGCQPRVEILEEVSGELSDAERFWIASVRAAGAELINHTDGGEGGSGYKHTAETRRRLSEMQRGKKRTTPRSDRRIKPEQEKDVVAAYGRGSSCEEIGKGYCVTRTVVKRILVRHDISLRSSVVGRWLSTKGQRLPDSWFVEQYSLGLGCPEIGKSANMSAPGVRRILLSLGVRLRGPREGQLLVMRKKNG
jgi:hypothetical protein